MRADLRRDEEADAAIRAMVERNPESALAYIDRWRYAQEFAPPGDPGDIRRALELGPDDPEVRLAAAIASEQGQDPAAARVQWEKGWALDPGNASLAVGLARLEVREGHLDRAEAVLRRADRVHSSLDLAFELAEVLIFQGKIEGDDQAEGYIARLRDAGFGETLVRFLEAEVLVQKQRWAEAIARIEKDRAVLRSFPRLAVRLDLMLADGYGRMGADELRLDALRRAADRRSRAGIRPHRAGPGAVRFRPGGPRHRHRRNGGGPQPGAAARPHPVAHREDQPPARGSPRLARGGIATAGGRAGAARAPRGR